MTVMQLSRVIATSEHTHSQSAHIKGESYKGGLGGLRNEVVCLRCMSLRALFLLYAETNLYRMKVPDLCNENLS